jgi:outer membrane protein assembly factor BamB
LPLADVRARLVLVSILEGSLPRAREELRAFVSLHGEAEGRLAGKQVKYAEALAAMIDAAESWPPPKTTTDWLTFAGSESRSKVAGGTLDLGAPAWNPIQLGKPLAADAANARVFSLRRVAEDGQRLLSYHPVVVGDLMLVNNQDQIFAFNLQTGKPAWAGDELQRASGEIFRDDAAPVPTNRMMNRGLGAPRFTMTVHGDKLFARMGSPITSRPLEALEGRSGFLVCLDLAAEGRLVWRLPDKTPGADQEWASDEKWAFEGSPVVDGSDVYVAMRKSDVRPQSHVACFDLETRRLRWRTFVCAAETPGGGQRDEITHNLLTLEQGVLYCNTNLGAVAAISARDGRLQWATLYPRARSTESDGQDKRAAHFYRDLNPCVYYRGLLLVAPSDSEAIFALAADNGESIWESYLPEDAVHLLGVGHGNLLASGDSLWWIDARQGKVQKRWPGTSPLGYGRGILVGDQVVWPTRDALYVFDQEIGEQPAAVAARDPIPLADQRDAGGGNLVASGDVLVIAASDRLYGFRQAGRAPATKAAAAGAPGGGDARNGSVTRDVATD